MCITPSLTTIINVQCIILSMFTCVYVYIYVWTICIYIYVCIYNIYSPIYTDTCIYVHVYAYIIYIHIYLYIYLYVCTYKLMYFLICEILLQIKQINRSYLDPLIPQSPLPSPSPRLFVDLERFKKFCWTKLSANARDTWDMEM